MKIIDIFTKKKEPADNRPCLQQLVDSVKIKSVDKAIALLASKGKTNNPIAIPYTPEAVAIDFSCICQCMDAEHLKDDELAALLATIMMHKHPKNISQLLANSGYSLPSINRVIYLGAYVATLRSLTEFASLGVKKYEISSCGDGRVCPKCAKHDGKKHLVSKAVIKKNAPPFCEKCRCVIIADFGI